MKDTKKDNPAKSKNAKETSNKPGKLREKPSEKELVFKLIFFISIIGLVVPFAAEAILPFFFPTINVNGVAIWNQYVSIILGVIATIMSITSLVLCYRSEESANKASHSTESSLLELKELMGELRRQQDRIENNIQRSYQPAENAPVRVDNIGIAKDEVMP